MATTPTHEDVLVADEVFIRVGDGIETISRAEDVRFDRQTVSGEDDGTPQLVFVGEESFRSRMDTPRGAIGIEIMGTDRWTIGFLDRTTDQYVALLDVDVVASFFEMVRAVETVQFALSFPESPEATQCATCRGTDHLNHVVDVDTAAGVSFIDQVRPLVGAEIETVEPQGSDRS